MTGDRSGVTFHHLLAVAGLTVEEIFITNAVLCSPRSESGANRPPKSFEIRNCTAFLKRTIEVLDPPFVVTVGGAALKAVALIEYHELTLAGVGKAAPWFGRFLLPVYHPSPQVLISRRSLAQQEEDWKLLGAELTIYSSRMTATASAGSRTSGERIS
jgi:DNA polymerase